MSAFVAAMEDLAEDLQQRRWVRQVIVDQHQRRRCTRRDAHCHQHHRFGSGREVSWPDPQVDQESADNREGRVNPNPTQSAMAKNRLWRAPCFASVVLTRLCSSSS
jgi:hypothetical protein